MGLKIANRLRPLRDARKELGLLKQTVEMQHEGSLRVVNEETINHLSDERSTSWRITWETATVR